MILADKDSVNMKNYGPSTLSISSFCEKRAWWSQLNVTSPAEFDKRFSKSTLGLVLMMLMEIYDLLQVFMYNFSLIQLREGQVCHLWRFVTLLLVTG